VAHGTNSKKVLRGQVKTKNTAGAFRPPWKGLGPVHAPALPDSPNKDREGARIGRASGKGTWEGSSTVERRRSISYSRRRGEENLLAMKRGKKIGPNKEWAGSLGG